MGALSPVKTCSGEHFVHSRGSIGNLHLIQHLILTQYHSFGMYVMCVHVQSVSMWLPVHSRTWCWMSTLIILHFISIEVMSLPKLGTRWVQMTNTVHLPWEWPVFLSNAGIRSDCHTCPAFKCRCGLQSPYLESNHFTYWARTSFCFCFCFVFGIFETQFLCSPCWSKTCYVD